MLNDKRTRRVFIIAVILLAFAAVFIRWAACSKAVLFELDGQTGQVQRLIQLKGIRASNPVLADDRILVDVITANAENPAGIRSFYWDLVALDAKTGRELWRTAHEPLRFNDGISKYAPMAADDIVVDDIFNNSLGVFDAETGEMLYQPENVIAWGMIADDVLPVALTGDRLIVRHQLEGQDRLITNGIQAYNPDNGDLLWATYYEPYPTEGGLEAANISPITFDSQRVYLEIAGQYQAFDIDSGDFLLSLNQPCKRARIQDTVLYCLFGDLKAYDSATGELYWSYYPDDLNSNLEEVEANADTVYVTTASTKNHPYEQWLIALDPADGSERWRVQILDDGSEDGFRLWHVPPSANEESVFAIQIIEDQKALVALSSTDGTQLWQFPLYSEYRYSPVSDGEHVYIVDITARWRSWLAAR